MPSQRVEKDEVTTVAIIANRLRMKKPISVQLAAAQSFVERRVSLTIGSALSAAGRAAIEQAAGREHHDDDGKLNHAHDHRDGRSH